MEKDNFHETARRLKKNVSRLPSFSSLEEALLDLVPAEYAEASEHFINSRIEFLKALQSLFDKRLQALERQRERVRRKRAAANVKKEKIKVE